MTESRGALAVMAGTLSGNPRAFQEPRASRSRSVHELHDRPGRLPGVARTRCANPGSDDMLAPVPGELNLEVVEGPDAGKQIIVDRPIVIGRDAQADLVLQ